MHITTKGGSSTQKKYATSMAEFCGEKLLGTRLFPKVSVEIQFVKNHNSKPINKDKQHPIPTGYCKYCDINLYGADKKPITACDLVDCTVYDPFSLIY